MKANEQVIEFSNAKYILTASKSLTFGKRLNMQIVWLGFMGKFPPQQQCAFHSGS